MDRRCIIVLLLEGGREGERESVCVCEREREKKGGWLNIE